MFEGFDISAATEVSMIDKIKNASPMQHCRDLEDGTVIRQLEGNNI